MKPIIFLDIDGVLNCFSTDPQFKSRSSVYTPDGTFTGIDSDKAKRLRTVVEATDAEIILTSSWKEFYRPHHRYPSLAYAETQEDFVGRYLQTHFDKKVGTKIADITHERSPLQRGTGIYAYLNQHPQHGPWVVVDDEIFRDYDYEILQHLVHTNSEFGLLQRDADAIIHLIKLQEGKNGN